MIPIVIVLAGGFGAYIWLKGRRDQFKKITSEAQENLTALKRGDVKSDDSNRTNLVGEKQANTYGGDNRINSESKTTFYAPHKSAQ